MEDCTVMLSVVAACSLLLAIICVVKRKSMYLLLGLIAGEIVGKFFYHLLLEHSGYGSNSLYVSIGFFASVVRPPPPLPPLLQTLAPSAAAH